MRIDRAWMLALLTILSWMGPASRVVAQYVSFYPSGNSPAGAARESYVQPGFGYSMPAAYMQPTGGAPQMLPPMSPGNPASPYGPMNMGQMSDYVNAHGEPIDNGFGAPCDAGCEGNAGGRFGHGGHLAWIAALLAPQCGPRWFNVHMEAILLSRDDVSRTIEFSRDGLLGPTVLSTENLEFDESLGFRATVRADIGPASNIEGSYFGTYFWHDEAQVTIANDNLYSPFSDFGAAPFGGFLESDQARLHRIDYNSELNNVELSYRRHMALFPFQGSWMMGIRYTSLNERFQFLSLVNDHTDPFTGLNRGPGELDYRVATTNDLLGYQIGGDLYVCLVNRLSVGVDLKAGIYGNHARQTTAITGTTLAGAQNESDDANVAAFVGELNVIAVYRITPGISIRAGYQFLEIDGVALAPENFNAGPPQVAGARTVGIDASGDVFYHGATLGFEWLW